MESEPYVLGRDQVVYSSGSRTAALGSNEDMLAVMYDASDGTLHKHGRAEDVRCHHENLVCVLSSHGFSHLAESLEIVEFPATSDTGECSVDVEMKGLH